MRRVIVESPYASDTSEGLARNVKYVREACADAVKRNEVPFASHLFFPQFLNDKDPAQRQLGIEMGYDFWDKAELVVFYTDLGMSPGMEKALAKAFLEGKPFEKRTLAKGTIPAEAAAYAPKPKPPIDLDKFAAELKT